MKTLTAGLLVLISAVGVSAQTRFDLKGDFLGESLTAFKANHPRIHCYSVSDVEESCRDAEAAFAGHNPYLDKHLANGLSAGFYHEKLTFVGYEVSNGVDRGGGEVLKLLTQKFGKPTFLYGSDALCDAYWEGATQRLNLQITDEKLGAAPAIRVSLEYIKNPVDDDI